MGRGQWPLCLWTSCGAIHVSVLVLTLVGPASELPRDTARYPLPAFLPRSWGSWCGCSGDPTQPQLGNLNEVDLTEGCGGEETPLLSTSLGPGAFVQMLSSMTPQHRARVSCFGKAKTPQGNMLEMPVLQRHRFISLA